MKWESVLILIGSFLIIWTGTINIIKDWHQETISYQKELILIHQERNRIILDNLEKH